MEAFRHLGRFVRLMVILWLGRIMPQAAVAQELIFRNYSLQDGLLSTTSYMFYQDRTGYIWVSTNQGLSRFNGERFTNFERASNGLPLGIMLSFLETSDGRLWVGGNGNGLFSFDGRRFTQHLIGPRQAGNLITALCEVSPGVILIGTDEGIYLRKGGQVRTLLPKARMRRSYKMSPSGDFYKLPDGRVRVLADGKIFTLNPFSGGTSDTLAHPDRVGAFDWMRQLSDGRLLAASISRHQLYVFRRDTLQYRLTIPEAVPGYAVEDQQGNLWVGTDRGFLKIKLSAFTLTESEWITMEQGLPFSTASAALFDRDHNLWLGSYGKGIYTLSETETYKVAYPFAAGLGESDAKNRLWYSTPNGLGVIERKPNGLFVRRMIRPFAKRYANSMGVVRVDEPDHLWLGSDDGHLARFRILEGTDGSFTLRQEREIGPATGFPPLKTSWIFIDSKKRIWVSERDRPVVYVLDLSGTKPAVVRKLPFDPVHELPNRRHVLEDNAGNFWLSYERHALRYYDSRLNAKPLPFALPAEQDLEISSVYQDQEGAYWFTTDNHGLIRRTADGKVRFIRQADGLLSDQVLGIREEPALTKASSDRTGRTIWVSTWQGLAFVTYHKDRIQLSQNQSVTESPVWSMGFFRDGMGWVATNFEIIFHRRNLLRRPAPPVTVLNQLLINGREQAVDSVGLTLTATENNLLVDFGSVYFPNWSSLRFRWKLEGSNHPDWSEPTATHSVNFAGLPPGRYTFRAKAMTVDGMESPEPLRFSFTIVPPVWQRWWFILTVLLAAGGLVTVVVRFRVRRLLELERLRARIAADLHDDIGSGLTRIALASEMLLRRKKTEADQAGLYQRIGNTSRELIEAMSDIVWSIDPVNDELEKVTDRIQVFANDICESAGFLCVFEFDNQLSNPRKKLGSDIVSSMVLIAKEAITNVAKHAGCQTLSVKVQAADTTIRLTVTDDGMGFREQTLTRMNGLVNMRRRAEKAGGRLGISSEPGAGTTIQVTFTLL